MTRCNRCVLAKQWGFFSLPTNADSDCPSYHQAAPQLHESLLAQQPAEAAVELSGYFCESWGNRTRVDYGSGMELNFLCWL
jgi:Phosphotyrosyl phosphate activator (PTPA) protein